MARLAVTASPFRCRWVATGSEMRLEMWTYAICLRCHGHPRVVSDEECGGCACWEPSADDTDHPSTSRGDHFVGPFKPRFM